MAEYIDKVELKKAMYQKSFEEDSDLQRWDCGCWIRYKLFENVVESIPIVDVQPVKWIPVTERLPKINGRYLTVMYRTVDPQYRNELGDGDTEVRITRYYQGEWKVPLHSPKWINEAITDIVTHWMPLPELPTDGEDNG